MRSLSSIVIERVGGNGGVLQRRVRHRGLQFSRGSDEGARFGLTQQKSVCWRRETLPDALPTQTV